MNMKSLNYKSAALTSFRIKNLLLIAILTGVLFSMYSCQYETIPIGTIVSVGAKSVQNS